MEREKRDLYNADGTLSGKTYFKGDAIPEGVYPMVVMILIENSKGEFLMQKRAERKGGYWAITGGHPKSGESPEQGIATEVMEELGLDISGEKLTLYAEGCDGVDCYKMFHLKKDFDITKCVLQEEEVSDVAWFSAENIKNSIASGEMDAGQVSAYVRYFDFLKRCDNGK